MGRVAGLRALQLEGVRSAVQDVCRQSCAGEEMTGEFAGRSRDGQAQQ